MQQWGHEEWAVVSQIVPLLRDNLTDVRGDAIDMSLFSEVMCVFQMGVTDITMDFNVKESATSGGTYTLVTGKSATQQAATDDNEIVIISVKAEELSNGMRYLKPEMDIGDGVAGANTSCIVLGKAVYKPATGHDLSGVAQVVV